MQNLTNDILQYLQLIYNEASQQTFALAWNTQMKTPKIEEHLAAFTELNTRVYTIKYRIHNHVFSCDFEQNKQIQIYPLKALMVIRQSDANNTQANENGQNTSNTLLEFTKFQKL